LLAACISTKHGYQLSSEGSWDRYGSSCAGPLDAWKRQLGEGVLLEISLYRGARGTLLDLTFSLDDGKTVALSAPAIEISAASGPWQTVKVQEFRSGVFDRLSGQALVELRTFAGDAVMRGEGRFSKAQLPRDTVHAHGDRFATYLLAYPSYPIETLNVRLPKLLVNESSVFLPDLSFVYGELRFVQCVQ